MYLLPRGAQTNIQRTNDESDSWTYEIAKASGLHTGNDEEALRAIEAKLQEEELIGGQ